MRSSFSVIWKICLVLVIAAVVVRFVRRRVPPYELGQHNVTVEAQASRSATEGPHIGNCPVFPKDNVWNTPVDKLPKDQNSNAYIESIGSHKLHPDFGTDMHIVIPFTEIPAGARRGTRVEFEIRDESDLGGYIIPPDAPIEGGAQSNTDRHLIVVDPLRCLLFELFSVSAQPDGSWKAYSGIKMDLTSNALRDEGKTSADAAGLPILPGLIRYDEIEAGQINHALRFTAPRTQAAYVWPGRHKASKDSDPKLPPMGIRFRLRADVDISKYSHTNQVILTALKRYGMFLADNGGPIYITGVPDKRWNDSDLHELGGITTDDFEAVNEADWLMLVDSARVDPLEVKK
jgi:hypothetical protein